MCMQLRASHLTMLVANHFGGHSGVRHTVRRVSRIDLLANDTVQPSRAIGARNSNSRRAVIEPEIATAVTDI